MPLWLFMAIIASMFLAAPRAMAGDDQPTITPQDVGGRLGEPASDRRPDLFAVDISPDGALLAAGHGDGRIDIWDLHQRQIVRTIRPSTALVANVKFLPDNRTIAVVNE